MEAEDEASRQLEEMMPDSLLVALQGLSSCTNQPLTTMCDGGTINQSVPSADQANNYVVDAPNLFSWPESLEGFSGIHRIAHGMRLTVSLCFCVCSHCCFSHVV